MNTFIGLLVGGIVSFFIMYWAVRLGVENALEARDERRAKAARAAGTSPAPTIEPDLES